jgi:hypothetical protein
MDGIIVLLKVINNRGQGEGQLAPSETALHTDSNELLFVSIALKLMEILVDCDSA